MSGGPADLTRWGYTPTRARVRSDAPAGPAAVEVGDVVAHRYQLEARAGAGGGGTVFRARDLATGAAVALKRLDTIALGAAELTALASIDHPAVIAPLAHGVERDTPYLVLPWLDGETLAAALARGPLPIPAVLAFGTRISAGLAAAHARGIVHRDVKPANVVLVDREPARATLIDFGVARPTGAPPTAASSAAGTPAYMAPEQARGDADIDGRADVFALGCVLHEALTGRAAFWGTHAIALVARVLLDPVPRADAERHDTPAALAELIARMLEKDRAARPDAAAVADALDAIRASAPAVRIVRTLGGDERRTGSVVVARHPRHLEGVDLPPLRRELAELGARLEVIGGDTLAVTIDEAGAATDRAIAAARAALAIQRLAGCAAAVATDRQLRRGGATAGAALDRAVELLAAARPGDVVVDDATAALVEGRFLLRAAPRAGARQLVGPRTDGLRRLLGVVTPLCGRDRELRLLRAVGDEVRGAAAPRVIAVTGAAGLGKSRLFRELASQLAGGDEPFAVWIGRGDPMRASSPFGVLGQLVRAGLGLDDAVLAEGRAAVRARTAGMPDGARTAGFLAELLGLPPDGADDDVQLRAAREDPILMHDQLRRAFAAWLAHAARARPIAVCVDDAQWSDAPSLRFLDEAVRLLGDAPVLFAVFARPDGAFGAELFRRHGATELRLGPLPARAAAQLVTSVLGDRDPAVVARLVDRAGGNALYLEELIRAVATGADALPTTVIAMVQARLDSLGPAARRALRVASLVGRTFRRGLIGALTGAPDDAVAAALVELVDREIVHRAAPAAAPDDDEYAFRHDLVREACYDLLTDDDLRAGHRAAADWLAARGAADPIVLATHYERGGAFAAAAVHLRRAAELALAANDFTGALDAARRAIEQGAAELGPLELATAEARSWRGELAAAGLAAERAAQHLPAGDSRWFRAIELIATVRGRFGDYAGVAPWAERARTADATETVARRARRATDSVAPAGPRARSPAEAQIACLCALARTTFHGGGYAEAAAIMSRVAELAPDPDRLGPVIAAQVHGMRAAAARHAGDLGGDLAGYLAVLRAFEAAGDVRNACNTRVSVGFAFIELGDWAEAEAALTAALAEAEAMGLATVATRARQNLCLVLLHRSEYTAARRLVRQTIAECRAHGNARFEGWTEIYRAQIELAAGHAAAAAQIAQQAAAHLVISPPAQAGALGVLARALVAAGQPAKAREAAADAMQILEPLGAIEEFEAPVRLAWALALDANAERGARDAAIRDARDRLLARAAQIREARWRDSFLTAVPDNRETLALAARWLTSSG